MKKYSFHRIMQLIFAVLFFAIIAVPVTNSLTLKADAPDLTGVENNYTLPMFSADSYMNGEYQQQFETALSKGFYGYNTLMRTRNELLFRMFKKADGSIVVCKDGSLIFQGYIDEYLGLSESYYCEPSYIEQLSDQLKSISELAEKQGKQMLVVITPTKAGFIKEQIPDKFTNMNTFYTEEERGVHQLVRLLEEKGVEYVDSGSVLRSQELPISFFPSTGIHWTREAADTVVNDMLTKISENGISTKKIEVVSRETEFKPRRNSLNNDDDLWQLMNILSEPDTVYSYPVEKVIEPDNYQVPNVFVQGGSFSFTFCEALTQNNIVGDLNFAFYNISLYDRNFNATPISDYNDDAIKRNIEDANIIILEVNESDIWRMGFGFYPVLEEILRGGDTLDDTLKISYESVGAEETQNGVTWRWGHSKRVAVKADGLKPEDSLEVSIWVPYSGYLAQYPDIPQTIEIEVYLNGELYDKLPCSEDYIFNIQIPNDRLLAGEKNVVEIVSPYTFIVEGGEYSLQILYAGKIR